MNNRKNRNEPSALNMPRFSKTKLSDHIGAFLFSFYCDEYGFQINLNRMSGCCNHEGYSRIRDTTSIPIPTCLLSEDEILGTKHVVDSSCYKAAGTNFIRGKFGKFLNYIKVEYILKKYDNNHSSAQDDTPNMLDYFKKSKAIRFTRLSNIPEGFLSRNYVKHSNTSTAIQESFHQMKSSDSSTSPSKHFSDDHKCITISTKNIIKER